MCGISGLLIHREGAVAKPGETVRRMSDRLRHRGPDGDGFHNDAPVFLGHRRLSIIDIAGGGQPMTGTSGAVVTFNGEIYNYREIREVLEAAGRRFRTDSDTEVLLQAFEEYGESCVEHFNGMFAFVIWCPERRALFMARDRLGEKPLYFADTPSFFAFASELKGLLCVDAIRQGLEVDVRAISDFLSLGYIVQPKSVYRGISQLQPGHRAWMRWGGEGLEAEPYWSLRDAFLADKHVSSENLRDDFLALFEDSVRLRLRADVPTATFLSGGVDSAAVLSATARLTGSAPTALTMGFAEKSFDESGLAATTAAHLGAAMTRLDTGNDPAAADLIAMFDEPFADTSIIPMASLTRAARRTHKVALSGDGADELLAGYPTYQADHYFQYYRYLPDVVQRAARWLAERTLRPSYRKVSFDYKLCQFLASHGLAREQAHYWWRVIFSEREKARLLSGDARVALGDYDPFHAFREAFEAVPDACFLDRCLYVDSVTWLPSDILVKVDRTSMAHGLEVRTPFLDHRLVEFCARLPQNLKMRGSQQKVMLKQAMHGRLPDSVLNGRKRGFNAPTSAYWRRSMTAVPAGLFASGFELDPAREDITFKGFALCILDLWMTMRATPNGNELENGDKA
ncbi:MAG: asparagine synthase (glutamine-hydrolyzing) [Rhodospirillales bacterium]